MIGERRDIARQCGAALIVVLLLVATLSFILLSITERVKASVERSVFDRAQSELLWKAAAAEEIVARFLEKAQASGGFDRMTPTTGLFAQEIEIPVEDGSNNVRFRDATRCFNVNALATASGASIAGGAAQPTEATRFRDLGVALGLGDSEAQKIASVITDFIDPDASTETQGAEDGFYTALPTPYRTAGARLASVSELRAMDGVSRLRYRRLKPYLCAIDDAAQPQVNLNMLTPDDAPLIVSMTDGKWPLRAVRNQIESRPPGGWSNVNDFWGPFLSNGGTAPSNPGALTSSRVVALVRLEVDGRTMDEKLLFEVESGAKPKALARTFGEDF